MYKVGFCNQCGTQVMVQDTNGLWNSYKPWFRQVDLKFSNGVRLRTVLCETCSASPDYQKICDETIAEGSESTDAAIEAIKKYGIPVSSFLAKTKQGIRLGEKNGN